VRGHTHYHKNIYVPQIYQVKRRSNKRHPLFYFITNLGSPLTAIVIVHIFYLY
jgi:hypothetical protein